MLQRLSITNYVLIEQLDIRFDKNLTIITGETGAGKSILLGALSLILGQRADLSAMADEQSKCIIEGEFTTDNILKPFFKENDLDWDKIIFIRREILPSGKSRAFVNDTPVGLNVLKDLGEQLIDIHSQHENTLLKQNNFQFKVLDAFADLKELDDYTVKFNTYTANKKLLAEIEQQANDANLDVDYLKFQLEELESAMITENEEQQLEEDYKVMSHAEEIKSAIAQAYGLLNDGEQNILQSIKQFISATNNAARHHSGLEKLIERIESVKIELNDIEAELSEINDSVEFEPQRLMEMESRLNLINSLLHKHKAANTAELLEVKKAISDKLYEAETKDERLATLKKEIAHQEKELLKIAAVLTDKRVKASKVLDEELKKKIRQLGMPKADFKTEITPAKQLHELGIDEINFSFNANEGYGLQPLGKIASGGELSRVMLCLKSVLHKDSIQSLIFDEIDTGVSGEIADKMGDMITDIAKKHQVICITHLPQVASKGNLHYKVFKSHEKKKTTTHIAELKVASRVEELAKMLSGKTITDAALENAKQLLGEK